MIKTVKMFGLVTLTILASGLVSCGTVTPNAVHPKEVYPDVSTPPELPSYNSGFLFYTYNSLGEVDGAVITENKFKIYKDLIPLYRLQIEKKKGILLNVDDYVKVYPLIVTKTTYWLDAQRWLCCMKMERMQRDGVPPDSFVMKLKNAIP